MCARFRWYWALNTMPKSLSFIWQAKGSLLKAISWFRNSMEEGKLTMGKKRKKAYVGDYSMKFRGFQQGLWQ